MKILLANKFFFNKGGAERVMFQERSWLLDHGHEVVDFSMRDPRNEPSPYADDFLSFRDFSVPPASLGEKLRLAANFVHCAEAVRKITALARRERPDVAHLHNIYHQMTPSIIPALKRLGIKVALTLHDYKLVCPAYVMLDKNGRICGKCRPRPGLKPLTANCQGSLSKGLLLSVESALHRWLGSYDGVDAFLAPSDFLRATVTRDALAPSRVRTLRNGIEVERFTPGGHGGGGPGRYALYVGRLSREKGVPDLLEGHARAGGDIPLKIVGDGPWEARLRERYPHAEFLGRRSKEEVLALLDDARFLAVPSAWYENCPMVVLEAMCMARPVLGSAVGGIPELVADGETGLLHACGDADDIARGLRELWDDPDRCLRMGRAARARAEERFSLERHMHALMDVYEELAATGPRGPAPRRSILPRPRT